jgi:hypothetical protein
MRNQPDFSEEFERAVSNYGYAGGNIESVETRTCASDHHDGVEYDFYGTYIPIRPIIDVAAGKEDFAIESLHLTDESTDENDLEPHLTVFVADLRQQQPHPAFTEAQLSR